MPLLNSFSVSKDTVLNDVNLTALNKKQMARVFAVMQVARFDSAVSEECRCYSDTTNGKREGAGDLNSMFASANYIYLDQSNSGSFWMLSYRTDLYERVAIQSQKTWRNRRTSRLQEPNGNLHQAQSGYVAAAH